MVFSKSKNLDWSSSRSCTFWWVTPVTIASIRMSSVSAYPQFIKSGHSSLMKLSNEPCSCCLRYLFFFFSNLSNIFFNSSSLSSPHSNVLFISCPCVPICIPSHQPCPCDQFYIKVLYIINQPIITNLTSQPQELVEGFLVRPVHRTLFQQNDIATQQKGNLLTHSRGCCWWTWLILPSDTLLCFQKPRHPFLIKSIWSE